MFTDEDIAVAKIKGYLNVIDNPMWTKDYVLKNYGVAVNILVEKANKTNLMTGLKSFSEGGQSMTFNDEGKWTINDDIKDFLPNPFIRMY